MKSFRLSFLNCVLSAVLLICPFLNPNLWIFGWVGLVPLFFLLQGKKPSVAFLISYAAGVVFFLGIVYWVVHVTLAGLILLVFYLAIYFGVFGAIVSKTKDTYLSIFIIPAWWVILEYIRSHLLTGFGWALLGYSQYKNLPVIQIADITGVYGVSFLIVLVNICIYKMIRKKLLGRYFTSCIIIVSVVLIYGFCELHIHRCDTSKDIKVSVIQGNIPQEFKWDRGHIISIIDRHFRLTKEAAEDNPDLIIWPEASFPEVLKTKESGAIKNINFSALKNLVQSIKTPLLVGAVVLENEKYLNTALLISKEGEVLGRYDKLHLVPFGEYVPLKKLLGFLETVVPIGNFTKGSDYTVFEMPDKDLRFSVLICFEDVFPELSRQFTKEGAEFLINITNDAWFKKTQAPYQHLSASVFRAVENRRLVVRSANTGVSGFIDAKGRLDLLSKAGENIYIQGIKTKTVQTENSLSFYSKFGNIFVLACIFIIAIPVFVKRKSKPV